MATYTISKIQLPNGDICNLKDANASPNATNSTNKLFLLGATAQEAAPTTYSNTYVTSTNGILSATSIGINNGTATNKIQLEWNNSDSSLNFVFVEGS